MDKELIKKGIAECFGTFVLVFFAVGTAVMTNANVVATALAFGLVIIAMAYTIGRISGCHVNPAVSLGAFLSKRITVKEFAVYVAAQFLGAIIGAVLLYAVNSMVAGGRPDLLVWGTNGVITGNRTAGTIFASLILEIILTLVFVYVILAVTSKKGDPKKAGIIIGLTLTLVHLLGINLTGTSVNPARSFGPALMRVIFGGGARALADYWIFLVAPLAGAVLAVLAFKFMHKEEEEEGLLGAPKEEA